MIAITRQVSPSITQCELTHIERTAIDYDRARAEHRQYCDALRNAGCEVVELPPDPEHPDSVFVEDTAVVFDEIAMITRPGAESRRGETAAVAAALAPLRRLVRVEAPATIDGGDVLLLDRDVYIGLSSRTNAAGVAQFSRALEPLGYRVHALQIDAALHLKTAVTRVAAGALLVNRAWIDVSPFVHFERIDVDAREPFGANALLAGGALIYPAEFPRTRERLERAGIAVTPVPAGELAKAEGGVTCCSLLVK